jgi:hypothetical protein
MSSEQEESGKSRGETTSQVNLYRDAAYSLRRACETRIYVEVQDHMQRAAALLDQRNPGSIRAHAVHIILRKDIPVDVLQYLAHALRIHLELAALLMEQRERANPYVWNRHTQQTINLDQQEIHRLVQNLFEGERA